MSASIRTFATLAEYQNHERSQRQLRVDMGIPIGGILPEATREIAEATVAPSPSPKASRDASRAARADTSPRGRADMSPASRTAASPAAADNRTNAPKPKEREMISKAEYKALQTRLDRLEKTARAGAPETMTKCPECGHTFIPANQGKPKDKLAPLDGKATRWSPGAKTLTPAEARAEMKRRGL